MKSSIEQKLHEIGLKLPEENKPAANYMAFRSSGNQIYISGQTSKWNGILKYKGAVGTDISVEDGVKAAETCALNILLQLKNACNGNLNLVKKCINLSVFIYSGASFENMPMWPMVHRTY